MTATGDDVWLPAGGSDGKSEGETFIRRDWRQERQQQMATRFNGKRCADGRGRGRPGGTEPSLRRARCEKTGSALSVCDTGKEE